MTKLLINYETEEHLKVILKQIKNGTMKGSVKLDYEHSDEPVKNCWEVLNLNDIDVYKKNKQEEQVARLLRDIEDLKEKLLYAVTKSFKPEEEPEYRDNVRNLKSILKEKLDVFNLIVQAREKYAEWDGGARW